MIALVAGLVTATAAVTVGSAGPAAAAPGPWTCDPYGYLFQTPDASNHSVTRVDLASGATTDVGQTADYVNAVGYNVADNYFYGWDIDTDSLVRINADLSLTDMGLPAGMDAAQYVTGDFDDAGNLWMVAPPTRQWVEVEFSSGSATLVAQGTLSSEQADLIPQDWSFVGDEFVGIRVLNSQPHLIQFDPGTGALTDLGALVGPDTGSGSGATYTDGTYLYASNNATGNIYRIDPDTRETILTTDDGPASSGNDGARCSTEPIPTITVTKTVADRVAADDQFTVALQNADGHVLTSATTSGTGTSVSTTNWPVSPNTPYTITDATTTGSSNTIDAYTPSISCSAGGATVTATPVDGETGQWTVDSSTFDAITCDVTNTPGPAGDPWQCTSFGYLFQTPNPDTHQIIQVDLASGAAVPIGNTPATVNAVGYNTTDNYMYGWDVDSGSVVRIAADGSLTSLGDLTGAGIKFLVGDFDNAGHLFLTTNGVSAPWFEIDLADGSDTYGDVVASGTRTTPAGLNTGVDWSWIGGYLYMVMLPNTGAVAKDPHLVRFDPADSSSTDLGPLGVTIPAPAGSGFGATYADASGYLYASYNDSGAIYRIDPDNPGGAILATMGPKSVSNDGARCASAPIPTITVTKTVSGRVAPGDQFTVGLENSAETELTSATTSGTATSVSTTNWPVSPNTTYTVTDTTTTGSPNTIDAYTPSISCSAGGVTVTATPVDGETGQWTVDSSTFDAITCDVTNTPKGPGTPFQCLANAPGMLFQHIAPATPPTVMKTVDMVTGQTSPGAVFTIDGRAINAVGYNTKDNYVYGWDRADNKGVVRIASDGSVQELGLPTGFGDYQAPNIGDVDDQGHYWMVATLAFDAPTQRWFEIDLNPGDDFMKVLDQGEFVWPGWADWAYLPGTNALYTVGPVGDDVHLFTFDRTSHDVTDLGSVGAGGAGINTPGAMYADPDGHLYTSNNGDGAIYRVDVNSVSAGWFADGPESSGNDGARCATSPIPIDFGDALDSYGTTLAANGPRHLIPGYDEADHTAPVMLGAHIDAENDGQPNGAANGDDTNGVDDEDGVTFNPGLGYPTPTLRTGYDVDTQLPVQNTLTVNASADGYVSVWVDWNEDGDFADPGEQVADAKPVTAGDNDISFAQGDNPPGISTYVRVRYSTDASSIAESTGSAPDGEVEDYRVQVERLVVPDACTTSGVQHYAFTFGDFDLTGDGGPGTSVRFHNVSVIGGVPVDMIVEVLSGDTHRIGLGTGAVIGLDDADWQVNENATLQYSFVQAGTDIPVAVNAVFTVSDMDGPPQSETATFAAADLAGYAVTEGSAVTISDSGSQVVFAGHGSWNGDLESRFQIVLEGISTLQASWQGGSNAGFGFDGDGDLSIQPPACSEFGDAPDPYGTTLANDGARATIVPGLMLGTEIDFDPDGQPNDSATGDDSNRTDDEDGVSQPIEIQTGVPTVVQVVATNDTDTDATLAGWIDLDYSDSFDAGELQQVSVPANSGTATYTLTWPAQDPPGDPTYARFRLLSGDVVDPSPTGDWPDGGEVEDYLVQSRALQIGKTSNATDATRMGDTVHYTVTVTNIGGADFTADNPAEVIDDLTGVLDDASFDGTVEVTGSDNDASYSEPRIHWAGPLASGDAVTLEYDVVLNKSGDQDVDNVAFQPPPCDGANCTPPPTPPGPDCDANGGIDPATDLPCGHNEFLLPKLTVTKSSDDLATAQIGDTVQYSITATNTGQADYTADDPAQMVDDLGGLLDDAGYDSNAAITDEPDSGPGTLSYSEPQISWTGALAVGDSVTVTYSVTITGNGDLQLDNIVFETPPCTTGDCPQPTPPPLPDCENNNNVDPVTGLSCDGITGGLPKLRITKAAPDLGRARIGDTITWTVTATNIGTRDYTPDAPAAIVDDLSGVLDDATFDGDSITTEGSPNNAVYSDGQIGWAGPLAQDDTVTITYSAVLTGAGDGHVDNIVWQVPPGPEPGCVLGDCPPPDAADCIDTGVNPDTGLPCLDVNGPLPRSEVSKTSTPANPHIGDTVTYTVTLTNVGPGDYTARRPAQIADDLTGVLDDASFDGAITTDGSDIPAVYDEPQIVWTGPLASGDTVTLTYQVTFTGAGDLAAVNVAYVPPAAPPCDADEAADCPAPPPPTPPDPDNCTDGVDTTTGLPCIPVIQKLPKLEVTKTSPDLAAAHIGDDVTYTVTAKSVGARDFTADDPALVIDDLSGVLDDASFDGTVHTDGSDIAATYTEPRISWTGPLAVGDTVTLTYAVRLTGAGDLSVENVAFVPPSPPACDASDAECPPYQPPTPTCSRDGGVDPATGLPCVVVHRDLPKLELTKTSPNLATASIGDDVKFTVTATNVGQRDFTADDPALVIDDLTGVLDDATFDGTVTVDGSTVKASYDDSRITWSGPLGVGDTVTLTYWVHLTGDGDLQVTNVAFVPPSPPACDADAADCPPYDPPTPPAPDCAGNGNVDPATGLPCVPLSQDLRKLTITKSSDAAGVVRNGDVVTYTVTATNVGPGDYTAGLPATVVDDLTGALDDATYNGDAAADVDGVMGYAKGQLSWVGALPAGAAVIITYSVTVTGAGDLDLVNVAFAPPPLDVDCAASGTCSTPPDCDGRVDAVTGQPCALTEMPLPGLYVTKSVDTTSIGAGDTVGFTVTMTNTGNVDFPDGDPAVLTDDLSGVLDDAAYNGDAAADMAGDLAYADGLLTWTGPLAVGQTVTVTYSVTVNDSKTGDDRLNNVASIPDDITPRYPGGVCPDGAASCDPPSPQAITVEGVSRSSGTLPNTGTHTAGELQIAALLLLFGVGLAVIGRRRRGHGSA